MAIATKSSHQKQVEEKAQGYTTWVRDRRTAGALLASAGIIALMAIITAEALYPAPYDTTTNTISDLGATLPPNSAILQPSAMIFDIAMIVIGLMIMVRHGLSAPNLLLGRH